MNNYFLIVNNYLIIFLAEIEEAKEEKSLKFPQASTEKSRASSLIELQQRLQEVKKTKKKLSYKEKLLKKGLKNRIKKKSKQDDRNAEQKLKRAAKLHLGETNESQDNQTQTDKAGNEGKTKEKPVFNKEDHVVYSKIDFANLGKKKVKKQEKDPKKLLENLKREKEMVKKLETSGEAEKAALVKEKTAWKNALAKAEGQKVKDDEELLKKTVKRKEQKVRSSKKKWEQRAEKVKQGIEERQKKRTENIEKRKKEKKVKKLKSAAKRGKIIPGF